MRKKRRKKRNECTDNRINKCGFVMWASFLSLSFCLFFAVALFFLCLRRVSFASTYALYPKQWRRHARDDKLSRAFGVRSIAFFFVIVIRWVIDDRCWYFSSYTWKCLLSIHAVGILVFFFVFFVYFILSELNAIRIGIPGEQSIHCHRKMQKFCRKSR